MNIQTAATLEFHMKCVIQAFELQLVLIEEALSLFPNLFELDHLYRVVYYLNGGLFLYLMFRFVE